MLPSSKKPSNNLKKYADTAIPLMIDEMMKLGAEKERMVAKLAGGATMFKHTENSLMGDIGKNNILSVKEIAAPVTNGIWLLFNFKIHINYSL